MTDKHPSAAELRAFAAGKSTDSSWQAIELHLERCDKCSQRFAELEFTDDSFVAALIKPSAGRQSQTDFIPDCEGVENGQGPLRSAASTSPSRIGRYRVEKLLGKGGFGRVYLAHDEELKRAVAIEVPHENLIANAQDAQPYIDEARTVAGLDHANIVPVFDVGSTDDVPCYVVSKYVPGEDLSSALRTSQFNCTAAAALIATVADALHHAHKQGLVHRDIKPGNILIGDDETPYIVDFGLALREEDVGKGPRNAGTPAYMSPEQARGEGHRVDGRSDVFSLGVMFYELLIGRLPFRGDTTVELLEQITTFEPRPLRQYDDTIPKELERICQKAMCKRASERYSTAKDMADDLRHFLAETPEVDGSTLNAPHESPSDLPEGRGNESTDRPASSSSTAVGSDLTFDSQPISVVPKGLRSFDEHDAEFFLELLPGARDRYGLPDSIRFWKSRVEETDPDKTFSVGLMYGASGCGKSSFVKAGLLPRLSKSVIATYVEAAREETESRLLKGLRKQCSALPGDASLAGTLRALRRGQGVPSGKKVLIVLDQFEQWLHGQHGHATAQLVNALRQCDGGKVQCIVMVRDDFWMAATRFMRDVDVRLVEAQNSAAIDLFPVRHAERVLAAFGEAFGSLPKNPLEYTQEQKNFVKRAVAGIAEEDKVMCVRLALFAEMMKGKRWTPATLKKVGGTTGIGVTFLEETFSASTAPPEHRYHQKAAQKVLKALLPDLGTEIKGHMCSGKQLLAASGYAGRPEDFHDLIQVLDSGVRLITPTDPNVTHVKDESVSVAGTAEKYYQLTHDYLVRSLRDWLARKSRQTRHGRAELRLAELAEVWNAKQEIRLLPGPWEQMKIHLLTDRTDWTETQRRMMWQAGLVACPFIAFLLFSVAIFVFRVLI